MEKNCNKVFIFLKSMVRRFVIKWVHFFLVISMKSAYGTLNISEYQLVKKGRLMAYESQAKKLTAI